MPKISVIIPNYNHTSFLKERIESVLNQTFHDFEIIILDDCSTDNSKEIIERYRCNPKVSNIVYNEQNSGSPFKQWEKGIKLAKGEWIWIAESDDVAERTFIETLYFKIESDNDLVLAFCSSMEINYKGEKTKIDDWAYDISDRDWSKDFCCDGINEIKNQFFYKNVIPNASAVIFKKSVIDMSIFEKIKNMKFAGDWLFWAKLIETGKVFYTAKVLNYFRYHENTTRNIKSPTLERERFKEYFLVLNFLKNRFHISWNWNRHRWILDEWIGKFYLRDGINRSLSCPYFPAQYNFIMFLKICLLRFRLFLR